MTAPDDILFKVTSFSGGLNLKDDPTKLQPGEYPLCINGRPRYDIVEPIQKPLHITDPVFPTGENINYQSGYSAGNFSVLFINGQGFYKDELNPLSTYTQIFLEDGVTPLQMDAGVERIYACLVPASTINYARKPATSDASATVALTSQIAASIQALVLQDGVNQPYVLLATGQARVTQTYAEWTMDSREYVPIGTLMLYHPDSNILYIVSANRDGTPGPTVYRSVSGRPIDFMVVLDTTGNKLPDEAAGGATAVSMQIDYNNITCLALVNSNVKSFFLSTLYNSWLITPDYTKTLFGEPTFTNRSLFNTGAINNFAFSDILGDSAFVTFKGIRSFNAVLNDRNEGRNKPFSAQVFRLFKNIIQTAPASILFDDYIFFALTTVYGEAVVIYDTIKMQYAAWDIYEGIGAIKQFWTVKTPISDKLLFITWDNRLFEHFATKDNFELCQHYIGDFTSGMPNTEQKVDSVKPVFINAHQKGIITIQGYVDGKSIGVIEKTAQDFALEQASPITPPFGPSNKTVINNLTFQFDPEAHQGWKAGFLVSWKFNAALSHIQITSSPVTLDNSIGQQAKAFVDTFNTPQIDSILPTSGPVTTQVGVYGSGMNNVIGVKTSNDIVCPFAIVDTQTLSVNIPIGAVTGPLVLETVETFVKTEEFTVTP